MFYKLKYKIILTVLVIVIAVVGFVQFRYHSFSPLINSAGNKYYSVITNSQSYSVIYPDRVLTDLWSSYKTYYIQKDGRVIDKNADLITTSEGQSYALLRAVWVDDKTEFDTVWRWTNTNLKRTPADNLFSWKWGKNPDGTWGVITAQGGTNTATDADQDIALSLILANYRWNDPYYMQKANEILNDIWAKEVVTIGGRPYLGAGNWASNNGATLGVNPSYYSFAAYPIFAKVDPAHDWLGLKSTSYEVLNSLTTALPPDWGDVSLQTGQASPFDYSGKGIVFSQDALRIPWRVALDWQWNKDTRAILYLQKINTLNTFWSQNNILVDSYTLDGKATVSTDSLSMYGGLLPYFQIVNPQAAKKIIQTKILPNFNADTSDFNQSIGYFNENWAWFGMALYMNKLPNSF